MKYSNIIRAVVLSTVFGSLIYRLPPARAGTENAPYMQDSSGAEVGNASNPVRVNPTGTTAQPATQSGTWTTGRTWTLLNSTDSVAAWLKDGSGNSISSNGGSLFVVGGDSAGTFNSGRVLTVQGAGIGSAPIQAGIITSVLPTGAATSANQSTEITSLSLLDDVPTALNGAFVKGEPAMGQLDDTSTTAATEDNVAPVRITAQRAEHVNLRNNAGTEIGTSGAPIRTDPTGTTAQPASQSGTWTAGRTWTLGAGTDGVAVTQTTSPWVVSGTVTANAGTGTYAVSGVVNQGITTGGLYGTLSVGTSATELKVGASRLTARRVVTAVPVNGTCYWGYSNAVTSSNGTPLAQSQVLTISTKDENPPVWLICTAAARDVRITESP